MGELFRPYIIYLTSEKEEELRKLIKQSKWKIGTFKRVHQDLWYFIDLIIKQEELALDTIEKCKKHTEGIRKAQKRKCSDKSTNTEKSNKIFRNDSYEISYSIELEDTDHNEIRRMISSGDETPNYHNYTFNQPEGKPVDATCSYDKGEAEQKYSNDKNVILENSVEKLDSSKSVQEKEHVQISGLDNVEMKTSLSDSNHETYQIESIPNSFLMNIQDNCNVSVEQNSCVDGVNKVDIPSVDTTIKGKSTNYNFRQRRCLDRFEMFVLGNICEQQDKLRCDICGKLFVSERSLKYHKERIHSDKTLKHGDKKIKPQKELEVTACQICRKQFADKYSLNTHQLTMHSENHTGYQCDLCGAVLKHLGNLVQHKKSLHGGGRTHCCNICGSSFKLYQHLKTHKRRHDPSFVETCTICGKTLRKGHLSTHMKRHSNEKKFKCNTCSKAFYEKQDLERHVILHSGEKTHKCPYCAYACAFKGNLTKHLNKRHTGVLQISDSKNMVRLATD